MEKAVAGKLDRLLDPVRICGIGDFGQQAGPENVCE